MLMANGDVLNTDGSMTRSDGTVLMCTKGSRLFEDTRGPRHQHVRWATAQPAQGPPLRVAKHFHSNELRAERGHR